MTLVCPDCAAVEDTGRNLIHEATCPLGLAVDKVTAADAEWFELHPSAEEYRRPISAAEIAELRLNGLLPSDCEITGRILVRQIEPGIRTRAFNDVIAYPHYKTI